MAWGRIDNSFDKPPNYDGDEHKIAEHPDYGGELDYSQPTDYSNPSDYSADQDYSQPSSRRHQDNPDQAAYHHGPDWRDQGARTLDGRPETSNTQNSLANLEKTAVDRKQDRNPDVAKQERANGFDRYSNGSWSYNPKSGQYKKKNAKRGGFLARHKKGVIGLLVGGGMAVSVFMIGIIVSGPMQFLQLANLFDDKINFIADSALAIRNIAKDFKFIARGTTHYDFNNGVKMGVIADNLANNQLNRFAKRGVTFSDDGTKIIFRQGDALDDIIKAVGIPVNQFDDAGRMMADVSELTAKAQRRFLNEAFEVVTGNPPNIISKIKTWSVVKKMGSSAESWLRPIKKLKQLIRSGIGSVSERFARYLTKKLVGREARELAERAGREAFEKAVREPAEEVLEEAFEAFARETTEEAAAKASQQVIDRAARRIMNETVDRTLRETVEETSGRAVRYITKRLPGSVVKQADEVIPQGIGIVGLIMDIMDLFCMLEAMDDDLGMYQMAGIVLTAMAESQNQQSTASQIMAGFENYDATNDPMSSDCNVGEESIDADGEEVICEAISPMEQLGMMSKQKLYNDEIHIEFTEYDDSAIPDDGSTEVGDAGQVVGVSNSGYKMADSIWGSAPLQALTGDSKPSADEIAATVPMALTFVGNKGGMFEKLGSAGLVITKVVDAINPGGVAGAIISTICAPFKSFLGSLIMAVIGVIADMVINIVVGGVGGVFTAGLSTGAIAAISVGAMVASLALTGAMVWIGQYANGEGLTIDEGTLPSNYGSIGAYGAMYLTNEKMIQSGGRELTTPEVAELWSDQRKYLAEEWAAKPLWAKLFDPADYRSAANVIARAADFNVADQNWQTQLGNVMKFFGSLPKLFGVAINHIGGVANAADSLPFNGYDFGVPVYGYSRTEQDTFMDDSYNMFAITQDIQNNNLLTAFGRTGDKDDAKHYGKLEKCLAVTYVGDGSTLDLEQIDNSEGTTWNYIDNRITSEGNVGKNYDNCNDSSEGDWYKVRMYVMDYFNMITDDCFTNNNRESCTTAGF